MLQLFEELINNTQLAEKLAENINKVKFCTGKSSDKKPLPKVSKPKKTSILKKTKKTEELDITPSPKPAPSQIDSAALAIHDDSFDAILDLEVVLTYP